ncbi:MAG: 1-(5-phosphoribosyl)-5-[(5-phosphoribosylamino)methylideneamino] imidazole-4-carboxamide isomerase [Cyclobacteriaceae bacterium]
MIQVIPSIAIRMGKVVKMRKGDPASEKAYDENPLDLAKRFQDSGIEMLHLVDLDGAEKGSPKNYHVLEAMCAYTDLKIDFTGGVSTDGDIGKAFEFGAHQITVASIAVTNPQLFTSWLVSYGREKVALGADVTDINTKHIAFRSWLKKSDITLYDHIQQFYDDGLKYVKSTDVSRDGVLEGPAFSYYEEIISKFPDLKILASGGVRGIDDIKRLNDLGLYAVIFGKAFYEGVLKLKDLEHFVVKNEG